MQTWGRRPSRIGPSAPGQARTFLVPGRTRFKLRARIDYPRAAGGAYLLQVTRAGKPLGPLLNKKMEFTDLDGRSFPYCRADGTYTALYNPDFGPEGSSESPYVYEWSVPGSGPVEVRVKQGRVHDGQEILHPLMPELLVPETR